MTAVRELIFAEVVERLSELADIAEVVRMPSADPKAFPALHIFDGGQSRFESEPQISRYDLSLTVEGYLEKAGDAEQHAKLNALYAAVVAALVGDPPLGGLAETIDEGDLRTFVAPLASKPRLGFAVDLSITFPTRRDDPAEPA